MTNEARKQEFPESLNWEKWSAILSNNNPFHFPTCLKRNTTQQTKHPPGCLIKAHVDYIRWLKIANRQYVCFLCLRLLQSKAHLTLHTLLHNFEEVKWLGIHPKTLRKAFVNDDIYHDPHQLQSETSSLPLQQTTSEQPQNTHQISLPLMWPQSKCQPSASQLRADLRSSGKQPMSRCRLSSTRSSRRSAWTNSHPSLA